MEQSRKIRFFPMLKFFSYRRTIDYFEGKDIMPINVEFSPSGVCPANCRKCFYRVKNQILKGLEPVFFKFERIPSLAKEMREARVVSVVFSGGGEPTSHPDFGEIAEIFHKEGLKLGLFTNALNSLNYDPKLFEWIRVTKTNYNFDEYSIKRLRPCKTLGLCVNYAKGDEKIIEVAIKIVERLDALKEKPEHSTYLQIRPEMNILGETHECELPQIDHPLLELTEKHAITKREYTKCEGYHFTPFIWQSGEVNVCAYHKEEKPFILGNLYEQSFAEIMKNAPRSVDVVPTCQACCKLHEMNKAIEERKNLVDLSFI